MSFVYVTEHGALIRLSGGKIIIEKAKKILAEIPKNTIDGMVILGSFQITSQAIAEFLNIGVPVTWVSGMQKFYGRLESIICDIIDDKKRNRMAKFLEGYGVRVQKSEI